MTMAKFPFRSALVLLIATVAVGVCDGLASETSRRDALKWVGAAVGSIAVNPAIAIDTPEAMDVDSFLRTGMVGMPMGVSGQAGKARPETGVVLRDGSEVSRDSRSGDVLAELLLKRSGNGDLFPVVTTFSSPLPLATGPLFDVECRDATSGDSSFLAVSGDVGGKSISDLPNSFFIKSLFSPMGRFSAYGQPTDIKVKNSEINGNYRTMDVNFSTLSQSTQTEIPRKARVVATIPDGSSQAVMLVASTSALRWKKGGETLVASVSKSFSAVPAPETSLKIRAKDPRS